MSKKRTKWSQPARPHGARVRVYERKPGGPIQISIPDGQGGYVRESLGHTDRERAMARAHAEAERLAAGQRNGAVTLGALVSLYLERVSPDKKHGAAAC